MEDGRVYLLTGAAGFLGNNIVKQLIEKGCRVRGLVLKGDKAVRHIPKGVEIVYGDLTDKTSLEKLVYVSSTGTVAELPHGQLMREPEKFDLDKIVGYYGKTKAMATQLVFDAVKEEGLKACVVYPTGICGPNDYAGGPVSTFIEQYCNGGNNAYDSSKAKRELGYQTRPFAETIYDEVEWLKEEHRVPA